MYKSDYVNLINYANYVVNKFDKNIWTSALIKALEENHNVYIPIVLIYCNAKVIILRLPDVQSDRDLSIGHN